MLLILVVLVSAVGLTIAAAIRRLSSPATTPAAPVPVVVSTAAVRDIVQSSRVSGTLAANLSLNLTPKIPGEVVAVPIKLGQRVTAGAVLVRLSTSDLQPQAKSLEAAVTAARAALARMERGASWEELEQVRSALRQAQTGWDAAVKAYERMSFLYREGAISLQQLEGAEAQVKVASAQLATAQLQLGKVTKGADAETLAAARAQVKQAEAAYEAIQAKLADAVLRAPADGVISYVRAVVGEMVAPGVPVAGLVDIDRVYLEAGVTESLIGRITAGQHVEVHIPAVAKTVPAVVVGVAPAADARTRLFQVRFEVPNPAGEIKPGMLGEVQVLREQAAGAVTVPRDAVLGVPGAEYAYIVVDGRALRRTVRTGLADDSWVEIRQGILPGDRVVTTGAAFLREGSPVNVVREETGG
jgi:multidrug efflux pump subunit AcrA (membrane-fusion protein)